MSAPFTSDNKNLFFLVKAKYSNEKQQVVLFFENKEKKIIQRHNFFPFLLVPKSINAVDLKETLKAFNLKNFKIEETNNALKISALNYELLKKIFNIIIASFNVQPLMLEPEREFLIEKGFSYFNSFELILNELVKVNEFPSIEFLEFYLKENNDLSKDNVLFSLIENIVLSNILIAPFNELPELKHLYSRFFLERILFEAKIPIQSNEIHLNKRFDFSLIERFSNKTIVELNLTFFWINLLENINFFEINCDCCKPSSIKEKNVLKNTLVEVSFKENAFYFMPANDLFALNYHKENNNKNSRIDLMNSFYLHKIPLGPFFVNEKTFIEVNDAMHLANKKKVFLTGNALLEWHCLKKENPLSKPLNKFLKQLSELKEFYEKNLLSFKEKSISNFFVFSFFTYLEEFFSSIDLSVALNKKQLNAFKATQFYFIDKIVNALNIENQVLFYDEKRIIFSCENVSNTLQLINKKINFDLSSKAKLIDSNKLKETLLIK